MGLLADTSYTRTYIRLSEPSDDLLDSYSQPYSMTILALTGQEGPTRLLAEASLAQAPRRMELILGYRAT